MSGSPFTEFFYSLGKLDRANPLAMKACWDAGVKHGRKEHEAMLEWQRNYYHTKVKGARNGAVI